MSDPDTATKRFVSRLRSRTTRTTMISRSTWSRDCNTSAETWRRSLGLEISDAGGHVISVSGGGGDLADGGGSARAAQLDDAAARPAPPDGLQEPRRQRGRARPALVRVQQHPAAPAVSPAQRRPAAARPRPPAAAEQRRVVAEDASRGSTSVLVVEQLDHDSSTLRPQLNCTAVKSVAATV